MTYLDLDQSLTVEFPEIPGSGPAKRSQPTAFQDHFDLPNLAKFPARLAEPVQLADLGHETAGQLARPEFAGLSWLPRKSSGQESCGSGSFDPSRSSLIASNSMLPTPEGMQAVHDGHLLDTAPSSSKVQRINTGRELHHRGASSSRSSAEEADHNQQVSVSQPPLSPEDMQDPLEPGSPDKLTDKMKRRLYLKEDPNYPNLSEKDRRRIRRQVLQLLAFLDNT